ncbi:unnamed protein product [Mycena citricolor]|uniref:Sugar phosphate transporter domain-containing protein n=1 Tax=Mycena citricolor TaxID=2018698 RepID=A0AAD2HFC5_9AGAR|nr:unnamed protein product [Mycena citricolor]
MVALNVLGLSFSNLTLKYVDASFYQVARGLVLPLTVVASLVVLQARPSLRVLSACGVVTAGFFCGVLLDGTPVSLVGVVFGVVSSSVTALASVVIKRSLDVVDGSSILLSWYTNVLSVFVFVPMVFITGEGPSVWALCTGMADLKTFLWGSLITGVVGFLISIAGVLSIKVTSPITHMVSSAVRGVASSFLGLWLFHDSISPGRAASITVVLGGSIYYTWVKHQEADGKARRDSSSQYERLAMDETDRHKLGNLEEGGAPPLRT